MNLLKNALKVSALSVSLFMSHAVLADEAKGLEIAQERKARDEGWGGFCCYDANDSAKRARRKQHTFNALTIT
ncbi:hypothetical protein YZOS03_17590 [Vibrio alginolyticus]|nr:hypothetical protein YZOS03_17590 [Vibrio alginolyticus]